MACALTLLRAATGHAAIVVDSTTSASALTANTLTWSHTVGAAPKLVLVVGVTNRDGTRP